MLIVNDGWTNIDHKKFIKKKKSKGMWEWGIPAVCQAIINLRNFIDLSDLNFFFFWDEE